MIRVPQSQRDSQLVHKTFKLNKILDYPRGVASTVETREFLC